DASIHAGGDLAVTAAASQSIQATVFAGAVALTAGEGAGLAISGAGVYAENKIATDVRALIDGDGADGITAASVALSATDASGIKALAGAASIAATFGGEIGAAISLALSIAFNDVSNQVEAAISDADQGVTTTAGGVSVEANTAGRPL